MAERKVRFHYPDGRRPVVQTLPAFARANGVSVTAARDLLLTWQRDGVIRRRADGGYDVVRYRPPRHRPPHRGDELGALLSGT